MENPVYESDRRRLVWILVGKLDVNLPQSALKRRFGEKGKTWGVEEGRRTVFGSRELYIELLHAVVDKMDFIVAHKPRKARKNDFG